MAKSGLAGRAPRAGSSLEPDHRSSRIIARAGSSLEPDHRSSRIIARAGSSLEPDHRSSRLFAGPQREAPRKSKIAVRIRTRLSLASEHARKPRENRPRNATVRGTQEALFEFEHA